MTDKEARLRAPCSRTLERIKGRLPTGPGISNWPRNLQVRQTLFLSQGGHAPLRRILHGLAHLGLPSSPSRRAHLLSLSAFLLQTSMIHWKESCAPRPGFSSQVERSDKRHAALLKLNFRQTTGILLVLCPKYDFLSNWSLTDFLTVLTDY